MGIFSTNEVLTSNDFSKLFIDKIDKKDVVTNIATNKNSQGISQAELDAYTGIPCGVFTEQNVSYVDFQPLLRSKKIRIAKYREMSGYPEISDAIYNVINDAVVADDRGKIVKFEIKPHDKSVVPDNIYKRIDGIFNKLVDVLLNFDENGEYYFKKWFVESELYLEKVLDKSGNLIGFKVLPAFTMLPIYGKDGSKIEKFLQIVEDDIIYGSTFDANDGTKNHVVFEANQVVYINYGRDNIGINRADVRGYLDPVIRPYNQLKGIENAIVVYRIVRAPERRVWNIYTGKMAPGKAEEFIQGLIKKYKSKNVYDTATGAINSSVNTQAATEDFWFSRDASGNGTTVDTVGGNMSLGDIEDMNYFLKKLYKSLKIPSSRWQEPGQNQYSGGRMGEVTREEIKFARFVERLHRVFKYIILDPLIMMLSDAGIDPKYYKNGALNIIFTKSNFFKEFMKMDLLDNRFTLLANAAAYIWSPENSDDGYFSREFVLKNYFQMNDEEYKENLELLKHEKIKAAKEMPEPEDDEDEE